MDRVRFLTHKGRQVLFVDYHSLTDEEQILKVADARRHTIDTQPKHSVLVVIDITRAQFPKSTLTRIKEHNVYDVPYVLRAAVVGADATHKGIIEAVRGFAKRNLPQFDTVAEALDFVVEEPAQEHANAS